MATAAEIQADIDKLKKALSSGAKSLTYSDGKRVDFRDVDELLKAIAAKEQELAATNGTRIVRRFHFTSDKDL